MEARKNITNDIVTDYINGFYEPLTDELAELREKSEEERVPIILKETESFLKTFLGITKPERILEIGCAVGYSAMFFAGLTGAEVYTVEKDHEMFLTAQKNIEKYGYSNLVTVLEGDGQEAAALLHKQGTQPFDFVFIDAAKSHYKRFLEGCLPLCKKNTVILSDNVLFQARVADDRYDPDGKYKTNIKKMREFLDLIHQDPRFDSSVIAVGDGLALTRLTENGVKNFNEHNRTARSRGRFGKT